MFKKSKKNKICLPAPPPLPSIDDILEDMKTFQMETAPVVAVVKNNNNDNVDLTNNTIPLETWWNIFEQFINDLKCLELINSEIHEMRTKLLADKEELEAEGILLKNEISKQQQLINKALE